MTNVYCFDVNFHKCTLLESYFIYVGDIEEFRQQCDKETISDYGVRETGCYFGMTQVNRGVPLLQMKKIK